MKINENTNIGLPLRNLIGLIGAVIIGAWFAFGVCCLFMCALFGAF